MKRQNEFSPIIEEVKNLYIYQREHGRDRADAIAFIESAYMESLHDHDDRVAVLIGLALALCKKKELTNDVTTQTLNSISYVKKCHAPSDYVVQYLTEIERILTDGSFLGKEAVYRRKRTYIPNWKIGDTFFHPLTHPIAHRVGLTAWSVIFYKVGEYIDDTQRLCQLVYVFLCPPGKQPVTTEELQQLVFLRMMSHGSKWDYLAQLCFKSKKDEDAYGLLKIGNFPGIIPPTDRTDEKPMLTMPLFGMLAKTDKWPNYEDQICRLYRRNQLGTNVPD